MLAQQPAEELAGELLKAWNAVDELRTLFPQSDRFYGVHALRLTAQQQQGKTQR